MTIANAARNGSHEIENVDSSHEENDSLQELNSEGTVEPVLMSEDIETEEETQEIDTASIEAVLAQPSVDLSLSQFTQHLSQKEGKRAFSIANRMALATSIDNLYQISVTELRKRFQVERALIYQFQSEALGTVVAESRSSDYSPMLGRSLPAIAFGESNLESYKQRPSVVITDTSEATVTPYQMQLFNQFQTKASLSLPIFLEDQLWGLLVVQQCSAPRQWNENEISFLYLVASELQVNLLPLSFESERQLLTTLSRKLRQISDQETLFKSTTKDLRKFLKVERVAICQFRQDYSLQFVFESKVGGLEPMLDVVLEDSHLQSQEGGIFRQSKPFVVHQVERNSSLSPCHMENLTDFGIQACAIVAIYRGQKLWGLLGAYQHSGARHWEENDIRLLSQVGDLVGVSLHQSELLAEMDRAAENQEALPEIINKISNTAYTEKIYQTAVEEVRQLLNVEHVCIYKFRPNYFGDFIYESHASGWPNLVGSAWEDTYVQKHQGGRFQNTEQPFLADDIYTAGLSECHIQTLEYFKVRSFLIVAIRQGGKLWGLLSTFQHSGPRHWLESDVKVLQEISRQMEASLKGADYIAQLQAQSTEMTKTAQMGRAVSELVPQILQAKDTEQIFQTIHRGLKQILKCDRIAIYCFNDDWSHDLLYPSRSKDLEDTGLGQTLSAIWPKTDLKESEGGPYRNQEQLIVNNIYAANHAPLEIEMLEANEINAYMTAPVFKEGRLWGLLSVYQKGEPRSWAESETNALKQVSLQLGVAMQQVDYLTQVQAQTVKLTETAEREKASKEQLQQQVIQLLQAVGPALQGDLTVRAQVTETQVGTVASAYNSTLQSLQKIVLQVQAAADKVSETSKLSETSADAVKQRAQQQAKSLGQALDRVQEMMNSTEAVAKDAQQVEAATEQTNQIVQQGDAAMNRTVDGIMAIRSTVAETNQRIKRLSESSQKVSKIVSLISNFTTQTQLLALNASIEATRAGEYGRGFAVVADEVRSLARQSAAAATEIEQFVQEIQVGTAEVSTAMETGIQQVAQGTDMVTDARQNLTAIVEATSQISQLIGDITQTTHKQADEFKHVTQTMSDATKIAEQTSESSTDLAQSIQQVLETAATLQSNAGKFKVE
ncbi:GAF domain protein [Synechococcus sp. PCC 7335]|uniref:GAF domain-containing protein n=1 Tax=Synechococcus sp. (strain ATCC 29403 / PCC 7335) TaxID=91464 RepID=UPI00017ECE53|nr:GAF domain-containing protein [Synechococcus sp. PCC 7335]EDX87280.1 GAF domain protein [Synechococcus sp. PCC 7335]